VGGRPCDERELPIGSDAWARYDTLVVSASSMSRDRALAALAEEPFRPAWWARSGLLQTLAAMRSPAAPAVASEIWATPDDDELHMHFGPGAAGAPLAPVVLLLHGLEGSRQSSYVRETMRRAAGRGWRTVALEFRSCGGRANRARRSYHSGETTDLAFVVARLVARFPGAPLGIVGWSLGGNVLLKWLGEVGDQAPPALVAAVAVSAPFDLAVGADRCDRYLGGVIARHFLRTLIPKAIAKADRFPGYCDVAAVRACRSLRGFDELVTAPVHGLRDAAHYYRTQSSGPFLPAIRRPVLLLSAADDPLSRPEVLPHAAVAASPFLVPCFPAHGGHVGFVAGGSPWRPRRWAEACAERFLRLHFGG
jgi:predicted alpha/beta-fold hydrolase